jgi:putative peptidoglycan lipid II flippase
MNRLLQRANKRVGLGGATALLFVISLVGQVLGFLRYKIINANFPSTGAQSTNAFFAAFKIPDFFFYTLVAGALGVAFMPILAEHMERSDRKGVWELANSLLNLLTIIMGVAGLIMLIFAQPIMRALAPGLDQQQLHNAVVIMRFISFNPLLFALSGVVTSVQQTFGRFFFYAIAPLIYNTAIIVSVYATRWMYAPNQAHITGLGLGAMAGALLQFLVMFLGNDGLRWKWRPHIAWRSLDFRLILRQLPARSLDQGIDSLNSLVETNRASLLGGGALSYYENAYILHTTPAIVLGSTVATAAFPRLTARLAQHRPDLFRKEFLQILRAIIWITLPVTVISYFARGYLARLIFTQNAPDIALIFGYLCAAIFFRTVYAIISRWFYAQKDTKTPLFVSIFAIALNIFLAITLSRKDAYGVVGLAMAQSIVAISEVVVLFVIMLVRDAKLIDRYFWGGLFKIISVTGFSLLVAFIMISLLPLGAHDKGITLGIKLGSIAGVTLSVHFLISWMFGLEEVGPILGWVRKVLFTRVRIQ